MKKLTEKVKLQQKILGLEKEINRLKSKNRNLISENLDLKNIIKHYDFIKKYPLGTKVFLINDVFLPEPKPKPYSAIIKQFLIEPTGVSCGFLIGYYIHYMPIDTIQNEIFLNFDNAADALAKQNSNMSIEKLFKSLYTRIDLDMNELFSNLDIFNIPEKY